MVAHALHQPGCPGKYDKLGLRPLVITQVSPSEVFPTVASDTVKGSPPYPVYEGDVFSLRATNPWNVTDFKQMASSFPCRKVRDLAVAVVEGKFDAGFAGDTSKCVVPKARPCSKEETLRYREEIQKEVEVGRMVGPFFDPSLS